MAKSGHNIAMYCRIITILDVIWPYYNHIWLHATGPTPSGGGWCAWITPQIANNIRTAINTLINVINELMNRLIPLMTKRKQVINRKYRRTDWALHWPVGTMGPIGPVSGLVLSHWSCHNPQPWWQVLVSRRARVEWNYPKNWADWIPSSQEVQMRSNGLQKSEKP